MSEYEVDPADAMEMHIVKQEKRIADLERQLAEAQRAAVCSGEEYEVLRLIQFYSRHDPDGSTLIGMFKRLDEIDARKPK